MYHLHSVHEFNLVLRVFSANAMSEEILDRPRMSSFRVLRYLYRVSHTLNCHRTALRDGRYGFEDMTGF